VVGPKISGLHRDIARSGEGQPVVAQVVAVLLVEEVTVLLASGVVGVYVLPTATLGLGLDF
jgi:hypothetical protein